MSDFNKLAKNLTVAISLVGSTAYVETSQAATRTDPAYIQDQSPQADTFVTRLKIMNTELAADAQTLNDANAHRVVLSRDDHVAQKDIDIQMLKGVRKIEADIKEIIDIEKQAGQSVPPENVTILRDCVVQEGVLQIAIILESLQIDLTKNRNDLQKSFQEIGPASPMGQHPELPAYAPHQ